jgi:hypothetical protein
MARFPALLVLLVTALFIAACGGGEADRATPSEPRQPQEAPTPERAPAEEAVPEGEQEEPAGLSVTTIQGEEVRFGGQGEVTALFFMAGW